MVIRRFYSVLLIGLFSTVWAGVLAQADSSVFAVVELKSNDLFIGSLTAATNDLLSMNEWNLGEVNFPKGEVKSIDKFYLGDEIRIHLTEHSSCSGILTGVGSNTITISSGIVGDLEVQTIKIREVELIEQGLTVLKHPNSTRYFFAPSAIPLDKGSGYYQNVYLLANSVNFGLTPNFTLGGGVVIPFLFYVNPKISFEVHKNVYVGAGFIAGTTLIIDSPMSAGIPFVVATYGNNENNVTVGAGFTFTFIDDEWSTGEDPIITVNGMLRISNRVQLVTENWFVPYQRTEEYWVGTGSGGEPIWEEQTYNELFIVASLGARFNVGKNIAIDLAPVFLEQEGIALPYLDFVYKF